MLWALIAIGLIGTSSAVLLTVRPSAAGPRVPPPDVAQVDGGTGLLEAPVMTRPGEYQPQGAGGASVVLSGQRIGDAARDVLVKGRIGGLTPTKAAVAIGQCDGEVLIGDQMAEDALLEALTQLEADPIQDRLHAALSEGWYGPIELAKALYEQGVRAWLLDYPQGGTYATPLRCTPWVFSDTDRDRLNDGTAIRLHPLLFTRDRERAKRLGLILVGSMRAHRYSRATPDGSKRLDLPPGYRWGDALNVIAVSDTAKRPHEVGAIWRELNEAGLSWPLY